MSFREFIKEADEKTNDKMAIIFDFFTNNPDPKDTEVHKLAEDMGLDPDDFETMIYSLLSSFLSKGNYNKNPIEPDEKELSMGIKVEMEHTDSEAIARRIALDHLSEFSDYYTRLAKMESEATSSSKNEKE